MFCLQTNHIYKIISAVATGGGGLGGLCPPPNNFGGFFKKLNILPLNIAFIRMILGF